VKTLVYREKSGSFQQISLAKQRTNANLIARYRQLIRFIFNVFEGHWKVTVVGRYGYGAIRATSGHASYLQSRELFVLISLPSYETV
jgi:hypothetical protein